MAILSFQWLYGGGCQPAHWLSNDDNGKSSCSVGISPRFPVLSKEWYRQPRVENKGEYIFYILTTCGRRRVWGIIWGITAPVAVFTDHRPPCPQCHNCINCPFFSPPHPHTPVQIFVIVTSHSDHCRRCRSWQRCQQRQCQWRRQQRWQRWGEPQQQDDKTTTEATTMTMTGEGPKKTTMTVRCFTALLLTFLLLVHVVCLSSLLQNDLKQYIRLMFSKPDIKISGGSKIKTG